MKAANEYRLLHHSDSKCTRVLCASFAVLLSFGLGTFYSQYIPKTIFTSPASTIRMMQTFPIGTAVAPIDTPEARKQFEPFGWGREPAVIVGYETVTFREHEIILCQVRTHRGTGHVITVNPEWINRARLTAWKNSELLTMKNH
jgi:hypothetical protein